jgi:sugar phosphate isomerase/epimerase
MSSIRLACGTDSFPALPHDVAVALVARMGFAAHDLMLGGPSIPIDQVRADIAGWAGRLDERIRGHGLEISDLAAWADMRAFAPNHPDAARLAESRRFFEDMLALAERLGAPGLTMMPGVDWPGEQHERSLRRAAEELDRRARQARERGLRFSIEPCVGSVCATPADCLAMTDIAPGLELTLDCSHLIEPGFGEQEIEPCVARARHIHVRGAAAGRLQAPMSESTFDVEWLLDLLVAQGYDGFINVEYVAIDWEGLNDVDVISETVLMRDRLAARLAGRPWRMTEFAWSD